MGPARRASKKGGANVKVQKKGGINKERNSAQKDKTQAPSSSSVEPQKIPSVHPFESPDVANSDVRAQRAFQWLLNEMSVSEFFSTYFEKKPFIHKADAENRSRFKSLLSVSRIFKLISKNVLAYGADVDVTSYSVINGRSTHNKDHGTKMKMAEAQEAFKSGCSIRLLRPQQHFESLWSLCGLLEAYWQTVVGANAYLTPADAQGFAPHFDDIDAFVCQISGRKHWRVYEKCESGNETLPRASSVDYDVTMLKNRPLVIDAVLEPGDMLYLPRGAVHEARAVKEDDSKKSIPSLHVTISTCQKWTWADFLLDTVKIAVRNAAALHTDLRRSLPPRFAECAGETRTGMYEDKRERFDKSVRAALKKVAREYPIDAAVDAMAIRFLKERLPPPRSVTGIAKAEENDDMDVEVSLNSKVRATANGTARMVMGEDALPRLVHCFANSRAAAAKSAGSEEEEDASSLTCLPEEAAAVDFVLQQYPHAVRVKDIPLQNEDDRVALVEGLAEMRVVRVL